ncbi:ATPase, partial [Streptomyces sp. 150FB]
MTEPTGPGEQTDGDPGLRHLLDRAVRVERRVRRAVEARRLTDPHPDDAFKGLYLTEETITQLLDVGRVFPAPDDNDPPVAAESAILHDRPTRLGLLAQEFGLTALDVEILLIALLPDLDDRFEAFYGYLNDDVTRRRPSIGLALGLCALPPA